MLTSHPTPLQAADLSREAFYGATIQEKDPEAATQEFHSTHFRRPISWPVSGSGS